MNISSTLDRLHAEVKANKWFRYFAVFNRIVLAAGFLPSGFVKIMGERFTALSVNHPMGHYLEALHHTGYYYPFIGVVQVSAAVLLLIPRTATLGAILYFPIILNICILSFAVRFDGSLLSSPLMVLANLYLLCWDYDKLKFILPFYPHATSDQASEHSYTTPYQDSIKHAFPTSFFAGVIVTVIIVALTVFNAYSIRPRNTLSECKEQCKNCSNPKACNDFCDSIHIAGQPLEKCLDDYKRATAPKK